MADSLITQVSYPQAKPDTDNRTTLPNEDPLPTMLNFNLRGRPFQIARDILISLPESLLIAMFPHGLAISPSDDSSSFASMEEPVYYVDYNPDCLDFVLRFLDSTNAEFADERSMREDILLASRALGDTVAPNPIHYQLLTKQAVIVLREELEFYALPPKHFPGQQAYTINELKMQCGEQLVQQKQIFTPLERNINKEGNMAEQHLIDMLCQSGYSRNDHWNHRALEPGRTCIMSMALSKLETESEQGYLQTAQKMLLFWKKPARKCWWEGSGVEVGRLAIRVWCRRTWTLELTLI